MMFAEKNDRAAYWVTETQNTLPTNRIRMIPGRDSGSCVIYGNGGAGQGEDRNIRQRSYDGNRDIIECVPAAQRHIEAFQLPPKGGNTLMEGTGGKMS